MDRGIPQILPHLGQQHLHFVLGPLQPPTQRAQADGLQPIGDHGLEIKPDLLEQRILRPLPNRQLHNLDLDRLKPGSLHAVPQPRRRPQIHAHRLQPGMDQVQQLAQRIALVHGPVITTRIVQDILHLHPAAGLDVLIRTHHQAMPVLERRHTMPGVHEIEVVARVQPLALRIIHHEAHVRRHPGGLDGAQIDAQHLGAGIGIAHLDGPDAGAGAQVDDLLRIGPERGEVQPVAARRQRHGVLHVLAVLLLVVVGEGVVALPELVVPSPVLEGVVPHRGRQRRRRR